MSEHTAAHAAEPVERTAEEFWEERYAGADRVWSGRVNRVLADVAGQLEPGTALDLGCGEGGDAVWLAQQGWTVTGVDLSATAIARGRAAAADAGIPAERLRLVSGDLATWTDDGRYDLVTASFLHSWPVEIPRDAILRRAADFVAPGGRLLIVSHAGAPSWADPAMVHGHVFPTPESDLAVLELEPNRWRVLLVESRSREATGPDGQRGTLVDGIVLVQRI